MKQLDGESCGAWLWSQAKFAEHLAYELRKKARNNWPIGKRLIHLSRITVMLKEKIVAFEVEIKGKLDRYVGPMDDTTKALESELEMASGARKACVRALNEIKVTTMYSVR